jgi:rhodanese-related sulfurtransferase
MKKFDDLMKISNEITNISVEEAKEKLNDPNVQFIDVRDKNSFEAMCLQAFTS